VVAEVGVELISCRDWQLNDRAGDDSVTRKQFLVDGGNECRRVRNSIDDVSRPWRPLP
jgi:hypothetical protein